MCRKAERYYLLWGGGKLVLETPTFEKFSKQVALLFHKYPYYGVPTGRMFILLRVVPSRVAYGILLAMYIAPHMRIVTVSPPRC